MTPTIERTADAEIRALLEDWAAASSAKDVERIMTHYAADLRAFDGIGPLQFRGTEAYRTHWEYCMTFSGDMLFEIHELETMADGDIAFCHYLAKCGCRGPDGKVESSWFRGTVCLRRIDGAWKIVHEHYSAPFDPESGKALLALQP